MFHTTFRRSLALAIVFALGLPVASLADNTVADGDGLAPVAQNDLAFGSVACNVESSDTALIAISRNGSSTGTNTFANSAEVTVSVLSVTGSGLSASMPAAADKITLPSDWTAKANNTMSASVTATMKLTSTTEGAGTGSVTFRATGTNTDGATIKRDETMNVTWTTGICAAPNTAPTLTLPSNMTVEGNTLGGANVTYTATANDTQDGSLVPSCSPASGSFFALGGPHVVSCSVMDSGNLTTSGSFTVTVVDTTGPVVSGPPSATIEGNTTGGASQASGLAALGSATATDTVSGDVTASITNDAPTTFPLGPTTVTYTATDGTGNTGTASAILTVVDTTAPTISGTPANITTTTMNAGGKVVTYTAPTASDIVDSSVPVNCSPASGTTFSTGTTTVTCSATDDSGNTAQSSFTVQVSLLTAMWKEPINGPSVINVAKAGRVIPVKVELFVDGVENVNTGSVTFKLWKSTSCTSAAQDAIESFAAVGEAAGGTAYVWNVDGGFYQYNLKTSTTPGCYRGEVYLDGELAGYFLINATK